MQIIHSLTNSQRVTIENYKNRFAHHVGFDQKKKKEKRKIQVRSTHTFSTHLHN